MSQTRKRCGEILVKDAIYRFIKVPPLCRAYMDTPEFQRLRRISQLGNVQYVYPSATHTRFSHSLGVMHLAGKQADGAFQAFAAALDGVLPEAVDGKSGADGGCGHQHEAADDQPRQRCAPPLAKQHAQARGPSD